MTKPKPKPERPKPSAKVTKSSAVKYVQKKWEKDEKVPAPGDDEKKEGK